MSSTPTHQKHALLKHKASLYTGFTIRESLEHIDYGEIKTIQIKDLPKNSQIIDTKHLTGIQWRYDSKPQFLTHNAILLVARGEPSAYIFKGDVSDKVVVSNPFIVITLTDNLLLPEFVLWYLNHSQTAKQHFAINARGNALAITTIATVKELPIVIPPLSEQQKILQMIQDTENEAQLFSRLIALKQAYNQAFFEQILNNC